MIIESVKVRNLHGYINQTLDFKPGLNILIGINGSGKTSVLDAIAWTLSPNDIQGNSLAAYRLANMAFDLVEIRYRDAEQSQTVSAIHKEESVVIGIPGIPGDLRIPSIKPTRGTELSSYLRRSSLAEEQSEMMTRYFETQRSNKVLLRLSELTGPLYLPLDRRWAEPWDPEARYRGLPGGQVPVSDAIRMAERTFRRQQTDAAQSGEKLRKGIIASVFEEPDQVITVPPIAVPSVKQVRLNRDRIVAALQHLGMEDSQKVAAPYFARLESTVTALAGKKWPAVISAKDENFQAWIDWATSQSHQAHRIDRLIELITQYEKSIQEISRSTDSFLMLMNSFLKDSDKRLLFDKSGDLMVSRADGSIISPLNLSSGELQLLTVFSFLHFRYDRHQQFAIIIDEPELSLHLAWQGRFIDSIGRANPDAQFILATHAPEITAGHDDCLIDLSKGIRVHA